MGRKRSERQPGYFVDDYAPADFTDEQERAAHRAGYPTAREKWVADIEWEEFKHFHESMERRAKAQVRMDQESVGVTPEKLGALAKAANALPAEPRFELPDEPWVPKDPYVRKAAYQGVVNRTQRLLHSRAREGLEWGSPRDDLDEDERSWERFFEHEEEEIDRRLEAFGGNSIEEVVEDLREGNVRTVDFFDEPLEPDNAELKRVYEQHRRAARDRRAPGSSESENDDWADWEEDQ